MVQGNIFGIEEVKHTHTGLMITRHQTKLLSKQQQTFNRLVKKIEDLRLELEQLNKSLNEKMDLYLKLIYPLEAQLIELNKESTKLLYGFFKNKKLLSQKERAALKKIIVEQLQDIFQFETSEPDDELKEIFKAIQGISYEDALEAEFGHMKFEMESVFEDLGFDVNFDDLHTKMTPEEMMKKAMEMEEELNQQANETDQKQTARKKTKKLQEKEEQQKQIEEARAKNISSIYKQLAKIFHPDLEQDGDIKLQKEELMKKLTVAYENNDLHTLLSLEVAWIKKEDNNPGKLTDDKLGIYNEVLKEQVNELKDEIDNTLQHQRYQPLQKFAMFPHQMKSINVNQQKQQIEEMKNDMAKNVAALKNPAQALLVVKAIIRDFKMQAMFDKEFEKFMGRA